MNVPPAAVFIIGPSHASRAGHYLANWQPSVSVGVSVSVQPCDELLTALRSGSVQDSAACHQTPLLCCFSWPKAGFTQQEEQVIHTRVNHLCSIDSTRSHSHGRVVTSSLLPAVKRAAQTTTTISPNNNNNRPFGWSSLSSCTQKGREFFSRCFHSVPRSLWCTGLDARSPFTRCPPTV